MNGRVVFFAVFVRELRRARRNQSDAVYPLLFFVLAVILYPFALGSDPELLSEVAAGVVWVAALLAASLSLEALFRSDYADGSLEYMLATGAPIALASRSNPAWVCGKNSCKGGSNRRMVTGGASIATPASSCSGAPAPMILKS